MAWRPPLLVMASSAVLMLGACGADSTAPLRVTTTAPTIETGSLPQPTTSASRPPSTEGVDASFDGTEPTTYVGHFTPRIIERYPHDTGAFTQGLEWVDGELLESTGQRGASSLRVVDYETGEPSELLRIDDSIFAEGFTVVDGEAIMLSYQAETLMRVDVDNLSSQQPQLETAAYTGEGWGLCHHDDELVMSDGSAILEFRDPTSFDVIRTVSVTLNGEPVHDLNELECVNGQVWANVWKTASIVAIDPATGEVTASVDATSLIPLGYEDRAEAVLNGIAYNPASDSFWLTGKLWPVLYEVEFIPAAD